MNLAEWNWSLIIVTLIPAIATVFIALFKERWPASLRDARRLTELTKEMNPSRHREVVERARDDLVTDWVIKKTWPGLGLLWLYILLVGSAVVLWGVALTEDSPPTIGPDRTIVELGRGMSVALVGAAVMVLGVVIMVWSWDAEEWEQKRGRKRLGLPVALRDAKASAGRVDMNREAPAPGVTTVAAPLNPQD